MTQPPSGPTGPRAPAMFTFEAAEDETTPRSWFREWLIYQWRWCRLAGHADDSLADALEQAFLAGAARMYRDCETLFGGDWW